MNFIRNYFQKRTNIYFENQDYEFAKELHKGMEELIEKGNTKYVQLQHLEGIFLDITDRTQAHPRVPFATEDRGGMLQNFVKYLGFGNRKIIWKPSDLFNLDDYYKAHWFPASLEMHAMAYSEMEEAKLLYIERRINFMEYFFKRLDVYQDIEATLFMKYYKGVDISKYKEKLRSIMEIVPVLIRDHDFD